MKWCCYVVCCVVHLLSWQTGQSQQIRTGHVQRATKSQWQQGVLPKPFHFDNTIRKRNGELRLGKKCLTLKDSQENTDYYGYEYVGDIPQNNKIRVVKKQLYNGNEYVVADTREACAMHGFKGIPYSYKYLLICFDESATTDRISRVDIWRITAKNIVHVKTVVLGKIVPADAISFSSDGRSIVFADVQQRYWLVSL